MKQERESNMRAQLAEQGPEELINTVIGMQEVIDTLNDEKRGWDSVVINLKRQNEALELQSGGDPEELEAAFEKIVTLKTRVADLEKLNEGLQRKLIG